MFIKRYRFALTALLALSLMGWSATGYAADHDNPAPDHEGKGDPKKGNGGLSGELTYVHMQPMVIPIINENGAEQIVTMLIDLQVKDFNAADTMHSNMPKVQDAIVRTLYGGLSKGSLKNGKLVDIPKTKQKLINAINQALGSNLVDDVLIQGVAQRIL